MEAGLPPPGFVSSLQNLGDALLGTAQDRLRLFAVELQEEKLRLVQILLFTAAAVLAGIMTLTFASLTLAFLFWESGRLIVLVGITVFYLVALLAIVVAFRRFLKRQMPPFAATLEEFKNDRACLRPDN
ncbi:MAG: hypothetical protein C0518_13350 [Opitutus sp.]|nr:hypothetical protein [Opitutus sp.]